MFLQILGVVAPVFLLALIGYVWRRTGHPFDVRFVSRLAMQVSLPALLFSVLSRIEIDPDAFRRLSLASAALYLGIMPVAWLAIRASGLRSQVFLAPFIFGNTGNVGIPIALFAWGQQGLADAMVVFAVMAVFSFTIGIWMVTGKGSPLEVLRQPVFHGAAFGILFAWMGWEVPETLMRALELVGQIAIPTMLITMGVAVAQLDVKDVVPALRMSIAKFALCALAGVIVAKVFGLAPGAAGVLILQAVTPVAVTNYLLAERYDADPDSVAGLVVVSTVLSVLTLPATLAVVL